MNIKDLVASSNILTDESVSNADARKFLNMAIADINTTLFTELPFFDTNYDTSYTALTDSWQLNLLIPYCNWAVKMNDGSITEAREYLRMYYDSLTKFERVYMSILAEEHLGTHTGAYQMDTSTAIDWGWMNGRFGGGK